MTNKTGKARSAWAFGEPETHRKPPLVALLALLSLTLLSACASLPEDVERETSYVIEDTENTTLARVMRPLFGANEGLSGFYLLDEGPEAFAARMRLINAAEKSLDVQYYIWHLDLTGNTVYAGLLRAADRGVRVRIILDDLDTAGKDDTLQLLASHPQISVRVYNPFANRDMRGLDFVTDTRRVNRRMHTKTITADNTMTVFGGRNIGDEYFAADTSVGFGDMDVIAAGPIASEVSNQFDLFWNSEYVYPVQSFDPQRMISAEEIEAFRRQADQALETARESDYAGVLARSDEIVGEQLADLDWAWSTWFLAYDYPDNVVRKELDPTTNLAPRLKQGMDRTQKSLDIVSPYFVPGEEFTAYLTSRVDDGVRVRILTNSLSANDVGLVHAGYMRYREALIAGGVELYEYRSTRNKALDNRTGHNEIGADRASLHAKFFGIDRRYLFIGSFNLDPRSVKLNTELGAYFEDPTKAGRLADIFDEKILQVAYRVQLDEDGELEWFTLDESGELVRVDQEPDTTFWQRFNTRILSPIVPEAQL